MAPTVDGIPLNENGIPTFEDLPLRKSDPHHSAWGLYGDQDELGTLNRLTNERVAAAAQCEIKTGQRISLNWPLNAQPRRSFFQRAVFHQDLLAKPPMTVNDDVWTFNSQVSTQWDGLRHFGFQKEKLFYNGVTMEDIHGVDEKGKKSTVNGIQAWAEQGIVGRGVLVDYHSWRISQGEEKVYDSFDSVSIPLEDLKACLAAQGTEVRFGDILFIRSGFMASYATKTELQLSAHQDVMPHKFGGVQQSEDMIKWIWDNFSAVAGDQPSFECWPTQQDWALHEVLLAGWGCPIGELFDLEKLAEQCKKEKRWSFFVSSEPCNVPGGVASPPNVLAIF
ncbi:uncharacterized protein BCR38DRAFT_480076 [Pseudomassariella vexata]|uniref:Cyclase-domain-containing protein n=1 Tax=Pseudomassariella vexata TaxID=1141098 RepID=A0A1Y2EJ15_9PEZI|nr:uncharacterized protein BCR38DRAFT_480076 [Pseudomassariella vexata]ORY71572.1 hypothetical protein BCR38DRAFT_480076 [Pseudomassariella vexata]